MWNDAVRMQKRLFTFDRLLQALSQGIAIGFVPDDLPASGGIQHDVVNLARNG